MSHTFVFSCIEEHARQRGIREEHHTTLPGVLWIGTGMDGMSRRVPYVGVNFISFHLRTGVAVESEDPPLYLGSRVIAGARMR